MMTRARAVASDFFFAKYCGDELMSLRSYEYENAWKLLPFLASSVRLRVEMLRESVTGTAVFGESYSTFY